MPSVLDRTPAPLLVLVAAFSVQGGAALATTLFEEAGPLGAVTLRLGLAALLMLALYGSGLRAARGRPLRWVVALGAILALMNSLFYLSLDRIPLGVAVTVEFLGPLAVAVAGSRHARDLLWVALAGAGIALFGSPTVDVDKVGLALAAGAGACWAGYIVVGKRLSHTWPVGLGLTAALACVGRGERARARRRPAAAGVDVLDPPQPRAGGAGARGPGRALADPERARGPRRRPRRGGFCGGQPERPGAPAARRVDLPLDG